MLFTMGRRIADERTRTAFLLITSEHVPYSEPARNGCLAVTFDSVLSAKYPQVHPSTAQTMLGHSDIRMTLAIYTHATDEMQDAATAALESAFG